MKHCILHITPDLNYVDGRSYYVSKLLKYLERSGHKVILATSGGDAFGRIGCKCYLIPELMNRKSFLSSVKRVSEIAKSEEVSIIHTHQRLCELIAVTARPKNVKTVLTALSIVDKRYFIEYRSDAIIAVSTSVSNMLERKFRVKRKKINLIPNFADSEENDESGISVSDSGGTFSLLSAGRFHPEKNYLTLLKAMKLLKDKDIQLTLVGTGEEKAALKEFTYSNELKVEFHPVQRSLNWFYETADACVLTSVRDPLPTFMLQSGLHGKAFAGTSADGIAEVIAHGHDGLLFPKNDEYAVAETIELLADDTANAKILGENLKKKVIAGYTEKRVVPLIEELYDSLFLK